MAYEYKTVDVKESPGLVINEYGLFGWQLKSSQTLSDNTVRLFFERDSSIKDYAELRSLEDTYRQHKGSLFGNSSKGFSSYISFKKWALLTRPHIGSNIIYMIISIFALVVAIGSYVGIIIADWVFSGRIFFDFIYIFLLLVAVVAWLIVYLVIDFVVNYIMIFVGLINKKSGMRKKLEEEYTKAVREAKKDEDYQKYSQKIAWEALEKARSLKNS